MLRDGAAVTFGFLLLSAHGCFVSAGRPAASLSLGLGAASLWRKQGCSLWGKENVFSYTNWSREPAWKSDLASKNVLVGNFHFNFEGKVLYKMTK